MGKRAEFRLQLEQQKRNTIIAMVVGIGLILLAVATFMMLPRPSADSAAGADERSSIPMEVNYPAPELALETYIIL